MKYEYDEDLFEETKMSFGEHLEELRGALWKSVVAIFLAFLLGLFVGEWIVKTIEGPLKAALVRYYESKAAEDYERIIERRKQQGAPLPEEFDEKQLAKSMKKSRLLPKEFWVHPRDLEGGSGGESEIVIPGREELRRIIIWQSVEEDPRIRVTALNPQEAFLIFIKAALLFGFMVASPAVFWFIWEFVAAGLYPHERRYVNVFLPLSVALFLAGAALAFFVVFRFVLDFLFSFNAWLGIDPDPRISEWLSFALFLPVGFGISFQLPLVMLFLERIGIFSVEAYLDKWRIAVMVIAFLSMILTPADPMSMMLMGAPLVALYFAGIAFCKYMPGWQRRFPEGVD